MAWFQLGYQGTNTGQPESKVDRRTEPAGRNVLGELNTQVSWPRIFPGKQTQTTKGIEGRQAQKHPTKKAQAEQPAKPKVVEEKQQNSNPLEVQNIDADSSDILDCADLANDIMENMFLAERSKLPSANYMELIQDDITTEMRSILIDWLVEVGQEYKLQQETLHLCIRLVDRYLSIAPIQRNKLQLLGVTCMFIASKFEEIYPPQAEDFSYITENTYTRADIIDFERLVLVTLNFELSMPTVHFFLARFLKAALHENPSSQKDGKLQALSSYLCELSLLEYASLGASPSKIAAASVLLALWCVHRSTWTRTMEHYSTYTALELRHTVRFLHTIYSRARANELPAVREKYGHPRYLCVSISAPPTFLPDVLFLPAHIL